MTNPLEWYFDPQERILYIVLVNEARPEEYEIDGTALCLGPHVQHPIEEEYFVRWIEISDNLIQNIGLDTNGTAIMIGNARGITFKRNEIHDKE